MAPEIFSSNGYSYKADIFSLGSVFYNLLTSSYLFTGDSKDELLELNRECDNEEAIENLTPIVSSKCLDLIICMLQKDPAYRPSPREALQFEWFQCDKTILTNLLVINKLLCAKIFEDIENYLLDLHNQHY